jgi:hypothetical protein
VAGDIGISSRVEETDIATSPHVAVFQTSPGTRQSLALVEVYTDLRLIPVSWFCFPNKRLLLIKHRSLLTTSATVKGSAKIHASVLFRWLIAVLNVNATQRNALISKRVRSFVPKII